MSSPLKVLFRKMASAGLWLRPGANSSVESSETIFTPTGEPVKVLLTK